MERTNERWRPLLEGGWRTARELAGAWEVLSGEARELCDYLGDSLALLPSELPATVFWTGCTSVDRWRRWQTRGGGVSPVGGGDEE